MPTRRNSQKWKVTSIYRYTLSSHGLTWFSKYLPINFFLPRIVFYYAFLQNAGRYSTCCFEIEQSQIVSMMKCKGHFDHNIIINLRASRNTFMMQKSAIDYRSFDIKLQRISICKHNVDPTFVYIRKVPYFIEWQSIIGICLSSLRIENNNYIELLLWWNLYTTD